MESKVFPHTLSKGFTSIPNAFYSHYVYFPGFTGNTALVYGYLIKLYNDDYGYAYPTQLQASAELNMSDSTFAKNAELLRDMGLLDIREHSQFGNNIYIPLKPIEDEAEFFATFPQALEVKRRKLASIEKIKPKKAESKRKLIEKRASSNYDELADWL